MPTCPTCHAPTTAGARFCSQCGRPLVGTAPVEGERKVATILFADVAHSTSLAEQLDPEDWAAVMNGAFGFMNEAVARYGGTVGRLMGDAVLAFFGAPIAHEDHAERAVQAALSIRDAAGEYAAGLRTRLGIDFGVRVGVSTGTAVLAVLGDSVRAEYTAMGDTANTAARLQSAAKPGTVLISGATQRLVRGRFEVQSQGAVSLKGKQAVVEAYEVVSARSGPAKPRGIEGLRSSLVGRDRELSLLRGRIDALEGGRGGVVAVVGEAGLGKSRLVAELREAVEAAGRVVWFEGRSLSYGRAAAYHPWQQIGREFIGAAPSDGPAVVREKLLRFVERVGVDGSHVPVYEAMMAVADEASLASLAKYQGRELVEATARSVIAAVRAAMDSADSARPCVLVFDDVHWADQASLDLLAQVAPIAAADPLLILCLLRPDPRADAWSFLSRIEAELGSAFARVDLEPLPEDRSDELLANLVADLPRAFRTRILERAEGNPFFLEEVLRSQIDGGRLVADGAGWQPTAELEFASVPATLAGVLTARIDRLPETTKRVAQTAAVIGRIFPYRALAAVCREAPAPERVDDVDPHLETLAHEELVRERARDPEREYIFKHALTCEAAYDLLLRHRRRELHDRAARALESLYPDRLDELAPVLAHHYHGGGQPERTAVYSIRAAEQALKLFAVHEALEHYDLAYRDLDTLEAPPSTLLVDAVLGWAAVRYKLRRYSGVHDRLARAEALARSTGDKERLARVLSWVATFYVVSGTPSKAAEYLIEANDLANELGDERLSLLPFFYASDAMVDRDPRSAATQLGRVVEMARKHRVPEIEGHALAAQAAAHARLGEFEEAETAIQQALAVADSGGHRVKEADVHIFVAVAYYDMGEIEKGLEHARIGAEMADEENAVECACAGFYGVGVGNLERDRMEEALSSFGQSLRFADTSGWRDYVNRIRGGVASAELERGVEAALDELEASLTDARADQDDYAANVLSQRLARAYLDRDDPERAWLLLEPALGYFQRIGMRPYEARALALAARIHEARGRPDEAAAARSAADAIQTSLRRPVAAGAVIADGDVVPAQTPSPD